MKQKSKWKTTAIIFIVLTIALTAFMIWSYSLGSQSLENEKICQVEICDGYDAYTYDYYNDICTCYTGQEPVLNKIVDNYN